MSFNNEVLDICGGFVICAVYTDFGIHRTYELSAHSFLKIKGKKGCLGSYVILATNGTTEHRMKEILSCSPFKHQFLTADPFSCNLIGC